MGETYTAQAMHAALIEYTIPNKPWSRMKRRRTTEAGLAMLEEGGALVTKRINGSTLEAVAGAMTESKAQKPTQSPTQSDDPVHRLLAVLQKGELRF